MRDTLSKQTLLYKYQCQQWCDSACTWVACLLDPINADNRLGQVLVQARYGLKFQSYIEPTFLVPDSKSDSMEPLNTTYQPGISESWNSCKLSRRPSICLQYLVNLHTQGLKKESDRELFQKWLYQWHNELATQHTLARSNSRQGRYLLPIVLMCGAIDQLMPCSDLVAATAGSQM